MSVVINTNSAATVASNNLAASSSSLQRSLNRLSSGSKIVNSFDDAGGLAVSMKLSAASRRSAATSSNIGNVTSYLQTQDGVLKTTAKVLDRMSELWTLSQDKTKNDDDLANYNAEFGQLKLQLSSLKDEKFNDKALFGNTGSGVIESVLVSEDGEQSVAITNKYLGSSTVGVGTVLADLAGTKAALKEAVDTYAASDMGTDAGAAFDAVAEKLVAAGNVAALKTAVTTTYKATATDTTSTLAEVATDKAAAKALIDGYSAANITGASDLVDMDLSTITDAIQNVATMRANNGAEQSRLGFATEVLSVNKTNIDAATSRIMDVDVAEESTQLARWNILVQAGTAMLSQANQSAQSAMRLLQ